MKNHTLYSQANGRQCPSYKVWESDPPGHLPKSLIKFKMFVQAQLGNEVVGMMANERILQSYKTLETILRSMSKDTFRM